MDFKELLFGSEDLNFLLEIGLRTFIMFVLILVFLKLLGKRGIKQLSVFELVVIIGLGSAAGDPMIYKEIGIVSSLLTFAVVVICYKVLTFFVFKYKSFENLIEGKPVYIVRDGLFSIEEFRKENLSEDEFFMELRTKGVYHLGQVEAAILEISGQVSVFFLPNECLKYGLPILPDKQEKVVLNPLHNHYYSCLFCGQTLLFEENTSTVCERCGKKEWILSSNRKREQ